MARENRRDNRAAAKAEPPRPGSEFDDLLEEETYNEDEQPDLFEEDAPESESDETATPESVDKQGEVDRGAEEVSPTPTEGEPEGVEVAASEEAPIEEPETAIEEVTEPTPTEPTPTEPTPVEKPSEAPETLTNEQAAELFTNWRTTTEDLLTENHYKLSDDDIALYNDDPAKLVSRVASRVYLDSISAAFQQFTTYLPRMVDQVLMQREQSSTQEASFFGAWPELKSHQDVVIRLGRAYRTQNPAASVEDFINEVGAQAMVALRLTPKGRGNGAPKPQAKAFKPASNAPANERIPPRQPTNAWEALVDEFTSESEEELDDN